MTYPVHYLAQIYTYKFIVYLKLKITWVCCISPLYLATLQWESETRSTCTDMTPISAHLFLSSLYTHSKDKQEVANFLLKYS